MKTTYTLCIVLLLAVLGAGCKPTENDPYSPATNTAAPAAPETRTNAGASESSLTNYTYAQKDQFVEQMRGEIADLKKEADQLGERIERSSGGAKEEAKVRLGELRGKVAELEKKLEGAESASADTWEEMKAGFNRSYEEMKKMFNEGRQWLSEKIAP